MATTPAKTPGPMIAISSNAQIKELMERVETIIKSAIGRAKKREGVVLLAARNATGTANIKEMIVPNVAMFNVSQIGRPSCVIYSHLGGVARVQISLAIRGASQTKNHVVEAEICCQQ
jgi:hypothetical protein